jgi:murein DD-endopeptidase MepM/ murein hydrolase activator NlpD
MDDPYIIFSGDGSSAARREPDSGLERDAAQASEADPRLSRLAAKAITVSEALRLRIDWNVSAEEPKIIPPAEGPALLDPQASAPISREIAAALTALRAAAAKPDRSWRWARIARLAATARPPLVAARRAAKRGARTVLECATRLRLRQRIGSTLARAGRATVTTISRLARASATAFGGIDLRAEWRAAATVVLTIGAAGYYFAAEHGRYARELRHAAATLDQAALRRHFLSDTTGAFPPAGAPPLPPNDAEIAEPPPRDHALAVPALDRAVALWLGALEYEVQPRRFQRLVRAQRGESFFVMLMRAGVRGAEAQPAALELQRVANAAKLRQGQLVALDFGLIGETHDRLMGARFEPSYDRTVTMRREAQGQFRASEIKKDIVVEVMRANGTIDHSVFQAGLVSGLPPEPIVRMINLFAFDVDFQRDLQKGDRFEVLLEIHRDDKGDILRYGEILYASLTIKDVPVRLYRWHNEEDAVEYYNERGENAKKTLMRSPIDSARLSSGFGMRKHPILGFTRLHQGIDFAAPTGTPIFASGHGTVEKAGWLGGLGNAVHIRHGKEFLTVYGHMSGIAPGIEAGKRLRQGEVIGYVGSTGLSTGPHLHYEVHVNDKPVDPLGLKLQSSERLAEDELERFVNRVRSIDGAYRALARSGATSGNLSAAGN